LLVFARFQPVLEVLLGYAQPGAQPFGKYCKHSCFKFNHCRTHEKLRVSADIDRYLRAL